MEDFSIELIYTEGFYKFLFWKQNKHCLILNRSETQFKLNWKSSNLIYIYPKRLPPIISVKTVN
jgi:hypothetical protein